MLHLSEKMLNIGINGHWEDINMPIIRAFILVIIFNFEKQCGSFVRCSEIKLSFDHFRIVPGTDDSSVKFLNSVTVNET